MHDKDVKFYTVRNFVNRQLLLTRLLYSGLGRNQRFLDYDVIIIRQRMDSQFSHHGVLPGYFRVKTDSYYY